MDAPWICFHTLQLYLAMTIQELEFQIIMVKRQSQMLCNVNKTKPTKCAVLSDSWLLNNWISPWRLLFSIHKKSHCEAFNSTKAATAYSMAQISFSYSCQMIVLIIRGGNNGGITISTQYICLYYSEIDLQQSYNHTMRSKNDKTTVL